MHVKPKKNWLRIKKSKIYPLFDNETSLRNLKTNSNFESCLIFLNCRIKEGLNFRHQNHLIPHLRLAQWEAKSTSSRSNYSPHSRCSCSDVGITKRGGLEDFFSTFISSKGTLFMKIFYKCGKQCQNYLG